MVGEKSRFWAKTGVHASPEDVIVFRRAAR